MPILEASNEIDDMQPLRLEHVKLYELYAPLFKAGMVKVKHLSGLDGQYLQWLPFSFYDTACSTHLQCFQTNKAADSIGRSQLKKVSQKSVTMYNI